MSLDNSGELRLIEIKGLAAQTGTILLTPNEKGVAEDRRDCYWLHIVTNCAIEPVLQEPIKDPAYMPWNEVTIGFKIMFLEGQREEAVL